MKDEIPTSTAGEWKFFRHIQAKPGTNLLVSAWLWEYGREALVINPRCLNWLTAWRKRYQKAIAAVIEGDKDAIHVLRESDPGFRLSAWMILPEFPRLSLCTDETWERMKRVAEFLPPCGGVDEPNGGYVRRRFYPFGSDEVFPVMTEDTYLEDLGVIERRFLNCNVAPLILPVELDLTKSNDFLTESFRLMVDAIRRDYEKANGPVEVKMARGKIAESARVPAQLKKLASKRLLESIRDTPFGWREAAKLAEEQEISLYAKTAHKSWFRSKKEAEELAISRAEVLDGLNDEKFLRAYEQKLEEAKVRLERGV